jgi:dihydropyrimidinase
MGLFIKNGTVVNADGSEKADVLIEGEVITQVGIGIAKPDSCREIDADGLLIIPGGIDPHTHLEMPAGDLISADDFESGGKAALAGGTTTVIDFVNPVRGQSCL